MLILQKGKLITVKEDEYNIIKAVKEDKNYILGYEREGYIFKNGNTGLSGYYSTIGNCINSALSLQFSIYIDGIKTNFER